MITINGIDDLDSFIINNQDKIILLYFGAIWCGPCAKLKDRLESSETKIEMPLLAVCYIDIDNELNNEIIENYKVKMLPTQIFIKLKDLKIKIKSRIDGYDWTKLVMLYNTM